ncbi:MAG: hypothetical protein GX055_04510 [Desulfovibrionales bacterium]|nr:hypothetical protein [Desulfovibrionales bacterium]
MAQYVGVSFRRQGNVYFFLATPFVLSVHDKVLVKTDEGIGLGEIVALRASLPEGIDPETVKPIYRPATQEDVEIGQENAEMATEARTFCQQCVSRLGLDMKLVEVEVYFDKSKMIFYFTSPGRVDFRELVKDLVRTYRTRIELRQIGVRHETQMIGALGNCGQVCCCRRYLRRFEPVTIKMAKDQNLFLNPAKISGVCGRLLCCLAYEKDSYLNFQRQAPKLGRKYQTTLGALRTVRTNMFAESVTALNDQGEEVVFPLAEWNGLIVHDTGARYEHEDSMDDLPAELQALQDADETSASRPERKPAKPARRIPAARHAPARPAAHARQAGPEQHAQSKSEDIAVSREASPDAEPHTLSSTSSTSSAPPAGRGQKSRHKDKRHKKDRRTSGHTRSGSEQSGQP